MKTIATFNALHLGDNLVHLHFLRKLAQSYPEINFTHGAQHYYIEQLQEVVADLPNIELTIVELAARHGGCAINAWMGAGGWWYQQPDTGDWCKAALRWFDHLAKTMGLASPFTHARDLLFDYPALKKPENDPWEEFDFGFLVVNSPPQSGQWRGYDHEGWNRLVSRLLDVGEVITTYPTDTSARDTLTHKLSVTSIGRLAQSVRCIIGCVTGPTWCTMSVFNVDSVKLRIHLTDRERVDILPNTTVHCNSLSLVPEILNERGFL